MRDKKVKELCKTAPKLFSSLGVVLFSIRYLFPSIWLTYSVRTRLAAEQVYEKKQKLKSIGKRIFYVINIKRLYNFFFFGTI